MSLAAKSLYIASQQVHKKVNVTLFPCLIKHNAMKVHEEMEIRLHALLTMAFDAVVSFTLRLC